MMDGPWEIIISLFITGKCCTDIWYHSEILESKFQLGWWAVLIYGLYFSIIKNLVVYNGYIRC